MLYRGMDRAQLDAAYNNSAAVPERDAIVADWAARSAKVRREYAGRLDLAYGDNPRERLDLFLAAENPWLGNPRYRELQDKTLNLGLRRVGFPDQ
jgi:hypothetical protein